MCVCASLMRECKCALGVTPPLRVPANFCLQDTWQLCASVCLCACVCVCSCPFLLLPLAHTWHLAAGVMLDHSCKGVHACACIRVSVRACARVSSSCSSCALMLPGTCSRSLQPLGGSGVQCAPTPSPPQPRLPRPSAGLTTSPPVKVPLTPQPASLSAALGSAPLWAHPNLWHVPHRSLAAMRCAGPSTHPWTCLTPRAALAAP